MAVGWGLRGSDFLWGWLGPTLPAADAVAAAEHAVEHRKAVLGLVHRGGRRGRRWDDGGEAVGAAGASGCPSQTLPQAAKAEGTEVPKVRKGWPRERSHQQGRRCTAVLCVLCPNPRQAQNRGKMSRSGLHFNG